jgi:hypothetical protein
MSTHVRTHTYTHAHTHTHTHTLTHTRTHARKTHTHTHTHTHVHAYTNLKTQIHTLLHIRLHILTYWHLHIRIQNASICSLRESAAPAAVPLAPLACYPGPGATRAALCAAPRGKTTSTSTICFTTHRLHTYAEHAEHAGHPLPPSRSRAHSSRTPSNLTRSNHHHRHHRLRVSSPRVHRSSSRLARRRSLEFVRGMLCT